MASKKVKVAAVSEEVKPGVVDEKVYNEIAPGVKPVDARWTDPKLIESTDISSFEEVVLSDEKTDVYVDVQLPNNETLSRLASEQDAQSSGEKYAVQAGDLNNHPELSKQGVQLYDEVGYGSLWVLKSEYRDGPLVHQAWPRNVSPVVGSGISFKP